MQNHLFWNTPTENILQQLRVTAQGLNNAEAARRLDIYGANRIKSKTKSGSTVLLIEQFKSPIILILIVAAVLSVFLHDRTDALIILAIVVVSGFLGFWQERGAANAVDERGGCAFEPCAVAESWKKIRSSDPQTCHSGSPRSEAYETTVD